MDPELYETLKGQVALVTGANRGIGAEIGDRLIDMGATVYGGVREPASLSSRDIEPVRLDVTVAETVETALEQITDEAGRLDILVNNAGVAPGAGQTLIEEPIEEIDEVLSVNLRGPILTTKRSLPHLLERDGGRVINVSSGMGALGEGMSGGAPGYRISKTGLNGLTVYLDGEFGPDLIANAVCPG